MKRFCAVLVLLSLVALPLLAQGGPRRGELIRADYGSGNRWAEVTQNVQRLIRGESLKFRVDNDTLGGDPLPGASKTLRLQFRDRAGRIRRLIFQENQYVDLSVNSVPGMEERGESSRGGNSYRDGLRITRGVYGDGARSADVTDRLNSQVRDNRLDLRVTNDAMGGDPSPRERKTLTVEYYANGTRGEATVGEGDSLNLPDGGLRNRSEERPSPRSYATIPQGAQLVVRTNQGIDSATSEPGQRFSAEMYADVMDRSGERVIPRGSTVDLVIRSETGSDLVLDIESLVVAGQRYSISTSDLELQANQGLGANKRTGEMVGGGAAVGAIIGAVLGGGRGAAIGAGAGAAGGAGVEVLTKGRAVRVPAETILTFRLDADLHLHPAR